MTCAESLHMVAEWLAMYCRHSDLDNICPRNITIGLDECPFKGTGTSCYDVNADMWLTWFEKHQGGR